MAYSRTCPTFGQCSAERVRFSDSELSPPCPITGHTTAPCRARPGRASVVAVTQRALDKQSRCHNGAARHGMFMDCFKGVWGMHAIPGLGSEYFDCNFLKQKDLAIFYNDQLGSSLRLVIAY